MGEIVFNYVIFISVAFMTGGLSFFLIQNGVSLFYKFYVLRHGKNSEEIDGIFVDTEIIKGKYTSYHPIFEFEHNGSKIKRTDKLHDDPLMGKKLGGKMKIYYNPDLDIVTFRKENDKVWGEYIFSIVIGAVLWLMAVVVIVYIAEGFCANPDNSNFIEGVRSLSPFNSDHFLIHDIDHYFDMEWFINGCLFGFIIIPIQYIIIAHQVGKTVRYGYYFEFYHAEGPNSPARFKAAFIYNLVNIAECIIFYIITRSESVNKSEYYPALCGCIVAILAELILSGIIIALIILISSQKVSDRDKVIYAKAIEAINDLKKGKGFNRLDLPIKELMEYAEQKAPEDEYKTLLDPYGLTCMNLWFLKALEEENMEDMRYIVKANRTLIADIHYMNLAQKGDSTNIPLYYDMFIFYSNYEDFEKDKAAPLKAIMLEKFFKQLNPKVNLKVFSDLRDFKYNYCMALYHYNFSFKKEPETTRSFISKAEEQIKTEKNNKKYSNAEILLFQRLINELIYKVN